MTSIDNDTVEAPLSPTKDIGLDSIESHGGKDYKDEMCQIDENNSDTLTMRRQVESTLSP